MKPYWDAFRARLRVFQSIRFRLTLWFVCILAVILGLFGAFVYYRQTQLVVEQATLNVGNRLRDVNDAFRRSLHEHDDNGDLLRIPGVSSDAAFVLQARELLILTDPGGNVQGFWGVASHEDADKIAAQMHVLPGKEAISNITTQEIFYRLRSGKHAQEDFIEAAPVVLDGHLLGWVLIGQPIDPDQQLPRLVWTLVLGGMAVLLVALLGGYWLADRVLHPVQVITRAAQTIGETDLNRRLNLSSQDELGQLANTFDGMLDRLQAAFHRQRQFTADASHELRTPLTIVELEADRALAAKRSPEEYRRALQVIQSENAFMTRLVGELLTLARLDAGQAMIKTEALDLSDVALEVLERYSTLAARKNIPLTAGDLPELPITGDRQYLAQMIGNLVENAIKYSPTGAAQWVRIETGLGGTTAHPLAFVRISDNGPGIPLEDQAHLFERFFRVDRSRSHNPQEAEDEDIPGSGLGLSIVEWIARLHGGKVIVDSQPGHDTTFTVELPLRNDIEKSS